VTGCDPIGVARVDSPSLYQLVEAALAGDQSRFQDILDHLTHALIDGGMETEAVWAWADRVCALAGVPHRRYPVQ
jgi:hypothetical protein